MEHLDAIKGVVEETVSQGFTPQQVTPQVNTLLTTVVHDIKTPLVVALKPIFYHDHHLHLMFTFVCNVTYTCQYFSIFLWYTKHIIRSPCTTTSTLANYSSHNTTIMQCKVQSFSLTLFTSVTSRIGLMFHVLYTVSSQWLYSQVIGYLFSWFPSNCINVCMGFQCSNTVCI